MDKINWERLVSKLGIVRQSNALSDLPPSFFVPEPCCLINAIDKLSFADECYEDAIRRFACWCIQQTLPLFEKHYPEDSRFEEAIVLVKEGDFVRSKFLLEILQHKINGDDKLGVTEEDFKDFVSLQAALESLDSIIHIEVFTVRERLTRCLRYCLIAIYTDNHDIDHQALYDKFTHEFIKLCTLQEDYRL